MWLPERVFCRNALVAIGSMPGDDPPAMMEMDAVGARLMKDILMDQVRRGATIFLTSHVLEVVERLCERVAIINEGKIVIEGTLAELRAGSETLEDVFVRVVGAERDFERLEWL